MIICNWVLVVAKFKGYKGRSSANDFDLRIWSFDDHYLQVVKRVVVVRRTGESRTLYIANSALSLLHFSSFILFCARELLIQTHQNDVTTVYYAGACSQTVFPDLCALGNGSRVH